MTTRKAKPSTGKPRWETEETYADKLDAVAAAIGNCEVDSDAHVYICLGPPRCNGPTDDEGPCPFCYKIRAEDPRSAEQILAEADAGN